VKELDRAATALLVVGGLNWGLVGLSRFDLVATIFGKDYGETNAGSRIVYGLVGLAAAYGIGSFFGAGRFTAARWGGERA
jgi:uncharacterized protein